LKDNSKNDSDKVVDDFEQIFNSIFDKEYTDQIDTRI